MLWAAVALVALPPLYVMSFGAALWLHQREWLSDDALIAGWLPLLRRLPGGRSITGQAVEWYARLWISEDHYLDIAFGLLLPLG